ncbi:hypothetical protein [Thiomicrorhabdus sp.]|uniref:hypothetical protein n=1 Tax=Thiomicrorhabdus sp. TaxID=2039724 RepID=UPI0029C847A2|nr:hypothetical protein [Thiomicrorhabdus sp.]
MSFLIRVKEQWPDVIRVLLSGYSSLEDTIRGVNEAGIYQYIEKTVAAGAADPYLKERSGAV